METTIERPRVTVVIVGFQSRDLLPRALDPLVPSIHDGLLQCIVVDNASTDGTKELIEVEYPHVEFIENPANIGFGSACNVGISRARSEYVLLLNPDAILRLDALQILVDFMDQRPEAGIVGPSIEEEDGYLNPIGGLPTPRSIVSQHISILRERENRIPIAPGSSPMRGNWLCGAIMMLRTRMLQEIGSFDPRFFLYFEETDLCKRAVDAGWQIWAVGESVSYHVMAASSRGALVDKYHGCIADHYFRSRYYYLAKHFGEVRAFLTETVELLLILVSVPWRWIRGRDASQARVRLRSPKYTKPHLGSTVGSLGEIGSSPGVESHQVSGRP